MTLNSIPGAGAQSIHVIEAQQQVKARHIGKSILAAAVTAVAVAAIAVGVAVAAGIALASIPFLLVAGVAALAAGGIAALITQALAKKRFRQDQVMAQQGPIVPPAPQAELRDPAELMRETVAVLHEAHLEAPREFWELVGPLMEESPELNRAYQELIDAAREERVETQAQIDAGQVPSCPHPRVAPAAGMAVALFAPAISASGGDETQIKLVKDILFSIAETAALMNTQILVNDVIPEGHLVSDAGSQTGIKDTHNLGRHWKNERNQLGKAVPAIRCEVGREIKSFWKANGRELLARDPLKLSLANRSLAFEARDPDRLPMRAPARVFERELSLQRIQQQLADRINGRDEEQILLHELFYLMQLIQNADFCGNDKNAQLEIVANWARQTPFVLSAEDQALIHEVTVQNFLVPVYHDYHRAVGRFI